MKNPLVRRNVLTLVTMLLTFSLPQVAFAQTRTFTTQTFLPFTQVITNPCANGGAGEDVLMSGVFHVQVHTTTHGNRQSLHFHSNMQGTMGVGLTTGDEYRYITVGQRNVSVPEESGDAGAAENMVETFKMVGPGPDNNSHVRLTFHLTINANLEITVRIIDSSSVCS